MAPQPPTAEDVAAAESIPLPPDVERMIATNRARFFAAMGPAYEEVVAPYKLYIKVLLAQLARAGPPAPPNRAARRAAERRAKKVPKSRDVAKAVHGDSPERHSVEAERRGEQR